MTILTTTFKFTWAGRRLPFKKFEAGFCRPDAFVVLNQQRQCGNDI